MIKYEYFQDTIDRLGITAYKVSKETGVPTSTLSDWKTGRATPKLDKIIKIADYLGVSVDYLSGREESVIEDKGYTYNDAINTIINYTLSDEEKKKMSSTDRRHLSEDINEMIELAYLRYKKNK